MSSEANARMRNCIEIINKSTNVSYRPTNSGWVHIFLNAEGHPELFDIIYGSTGDKTVDTVKHTSRSLNAMPMPKRVEVAKKLGLPTESNPMKLTKMILDAQAKVDRGE